VDYQLAYYALYQAQRTSLRLTPEHIMVGIALISAFVGMVWKLAHQSKQIAINENTAKKAHDRIDKLKEDREGEMSEVSARLEKIGNTLGRFEERIINTSKEITELKEEVKKFRKRSTDD